MNQNCIIDTHTHLCDPSFDDDRREVLKRAHSSGISSIILVSEDLADAQKNLKLAKQYPMLKPAAGLYPTHLDFDTAETMIAFIREHKEQLVAIGEVGLDYWAVKDEYQKEIQREIFKQFARLSMELDLPLNVHSRSAGRHAIEILVNIGAQKVQMHAFDGKYSTALPAVEAGYYFSIPPSIVRSRQKQKLVKQLPLSCLLIETDSPVLGPEPQTRNEPANAMMVINRIAEIKGITPQEIMAVTTSNSLNLYGPSNT